MPARPARLTIRVNNICVVILSSIATNVVAHLAKSSRSLTDCHQYKDAALSFATTRLAFTAGKTTDLYALLIGQIGSMDEPATSSVKGTDRRKCEVSRGQTSGVEDW